MFSFECLERFICVICSDLMIEPVSLPCKHTACHNCVQKTFDSNKYQCFLCRKFIGSWYRNARKRGSLINKELKQDFINSYPVLFAERLKGKTLNIVSTSSPILICSPGEIKHEYESEMQKLKRELAAQKEIENRLSVEFIKQIDEEESILRRQEEELLKTDEQIARELEQEINSASLKIEDERKKELIRDEALARELSSDDNSLKKVISRSVTPSTKRLSKTINGPMDRFLVKKRKFEL